jgi:hypothetical protein
MLRICTSTFPYIILLFIAVLLVVFGWGYRWYKQKSLNQLGGYDRNTRILFFLILIAAVSVGLFTIYTFMEVGAC